MLALLWTACFGPLAQKDAGPSAPADLVVFADRAVVVLDGRIDDVTDDIGAAQARVGPETTVLRAQRVTPGFVDAHIHPVSYGRSLSDLDLVGAKTYAETLERVAGAAGTGKGWLRGRGWDHNDWSDTPEGVWPRAIDLDPITGDRPTVLTRIDGHAVWLNSAALEAAGITASTADPNGGRLVRDATGAPTGVLIDNATALIPKTQATKVEIRAWLVAGLEALARVGLTGVHVMGADDDTLAVFEYLDAKGTLPLRAWIYVNPDSKAAARLASEGPWAGDHVKVMGVKVYADGALGSRGALLSAPYADDEGNSGLAVTDPAALKALAKSLTPMGAQVAIHAIGDLAVRHALDAIEAARESSPDVPVRHRVEHAQVVHPDDVPRFAALEVAASMQPTHATSDMPWAGARLGEERLAWSYAWRTLADAGAVLAFGSDAPVEDPAPTLGIRAAVTRTGVGGEPEGGWRPQEALTVDEAVAAYTSGAAWAVQEQANLGTLEVGKLADLTLWTVDPGTYWFPMATVVGGHVLWRSADRAAP